MNGKTISSLSLINDIRSNKIIVTNVYSYYSKNKDFCEYNNNLNDIIDKVNLGIYNENYLIFFDELFSVLPDDKFKKLPKHIKSFITQMRKRHMYLITTVQEWLDVNVSFRRYVRYYVQCHIFNFLGLFAVLINQVHNGYAIKWDKDLNEYDSPIIYTTIKKCSKKLADSYDTDEVIESS